MPLESLLLDRLGTAFQSVVGHRADPVLRRSQHADFQADGALPLARELGRPPRDIAADVLAAAELWPLAETATVSGPGYINITLSAAPHHRRLIHHSEWTVRIKEGRPVFVPPDG